MIRPGGLILLLLVAPRLARGEAPITDRNYAFDAYRGAAIADYREIGMGGVSLATAEGALGLLSNPAAAASRPATANDWFWWDFLFDAYTPSIGVDYDNNGTLQDAFNTKSGALNAGLLGMFGAWGFAASVTAELRALSFSGGSEARLSAALWRLTVARSFFDGEWTVGASLVGGGFDLQLPSTSTGLLSAGDWTVEAGTLWRPLESNWRAGASFRPTMQARIDPAQCDPNNCSGYILPQRTEFPWTAGAGVAVRLGPTPWNRRVPDDFRDEKSTILAADVLVSGPVSDGAGLEAFLDKQLQPSGRHASVSVRFGAEYEWVPGWFRIRGGTYWEPPRFDDVEGRLHVTVGFDLRFWSFSFWESKYRLRLSLAGDGASHYGNTMLSIGFWH